MTAPMIKPLGRNEPCRCGSRRKYKQCCLEKDQAAERTARAKQADKAAPVAEAEAEPEAEAPRGTPAPKHATHQPWKGKQDSRGFQNKKAHIPRRSGGS